jgi:hypothetical protein
LSKLSEQLRAIKVHNNFEMLMRFGGADDVAIEYHRPAPGRLGWADSHRTTVWSPKANPKLPAPKRFALSVRGEKEFVGMRKLSFAGAVAWAVAQFGHKYVPSPFGGQIPVHVLVKAKAAVKGESK